MNTDVSRNREFIEYWRLERNSIVEALRKAKPSMSDLAMLSVEERDAILDDLEKNGSSDYSFVNDLWERLKYLRDLPVYNFSLDYVSRFHSFVSDEVAVWYEVTKEKKK
ncbi:hypothetical protein Q7M76_04835 [Candidatus Liberibacter asiaticus]|uniref:Uncharacterized protein n=2 Tax=Liberibacter asiaticus TaxID=34021 RepID=C6XGQ2_LIBAP|nr:hypothetical protein [Candidatus Liberibacter asiaticus]QHZ60139.1 hypothetical protein pCLasA4_gp03 [Liberibacter phage pCLasA4]QHZ60147.1 hypothetical protein pCLasGDCZ2_gp03 [Liberibacter phage pCLasGDCZ2]QHZ60155.1 hypothetical protein pCLasGDDQ6_gp03 [Liberibacter phage pCLasGDDQ6]QHZ60163.1 hypothetical protein pCLasGDDQ7_gp03 [Liberibacter phage pCLasGDDQ7]QHZ60171.1 hypothetical protein pCLasGDQY1_gp03 [Liberibacter phage pCLasGDQY1]QHZ60179.1 hypothetical protein pCLasGDXH1_gp03 [